MPAIAAPSARPGRLRRGLRLWHRAFGLGAGLWLVLLALTGSAIAFHDELDGWLNVDLRRVPTGSVARPDVAAALRAAANALPGFSARYIDLPNVDGESLSMLGSAPLGRGEDSTVQVFVDPRNAQLLGWRDLEHLSLHPHHLVNTLYVVHTELLLHETGVWLIGLLALLWTLDHFAGVALAIPRLASAREAWRIRGRGLNLRRLYDLHRAPSLWLLPVTFTLALSGWCLSWHEETRALASLVSPTTGRLHEDFPDAVAQPQAGAQDPALRIDAAIDKVRAQVNGRIDSLLLIPRKAAWGVRSFDPRDIDDFGRLWTYVSMIDGSILGQRHDTGHTAADTFFVWQYPLHSGRAFGLAGQAIVSAAGVGTAALGVTGVALWRRRRRRDRAPRLRQ